MTTTQLKRPHVASAHGNNRQFLSVAPNTILTHELGWHHSTIGIPDERNPIFPPPRRPSAAAPVPDLELRASSPSHATSCQKMR
jgi:hypothetical protein